MSFQDKIAIATSDLKRSLRDYEIEVSGTELKVIQLKTNENNYGDETITIIADSLITVVFDIPDGIPLDRLRSSVGSPYIDTENTFIHDIIPIEGYPKFEDHVEKGDILVSKVYDENEDTPLLWILRVSEILGSISQNRLTHRWFQCAPHLMKLPIAAQDIIDSYEVYEEAL